MVTDQGGNIVWQWDNTDPFGSNLPNQDPNGTGNQFVFNLRFPGQYSDIETGTHYNLNRNYNPATGRYVESDPLGLDGGQFSTYAYVNGNPLNRFDPSGLATPEDIATALCIIKQGTYGVYNKPPKSVTPIKDLHNWAGMDLQGYTDTDNNIQTDARLYGDSNTSVGFWNDRAFLQTLAHEWYHVQQSTFEKMLTHGELHEVIDQNAELVSDMVYKAFRAQQERNKKGDGGGPCGCGKNKK